MPSAFETRFANARTQLVRVHGTEGILFTPNAPADAAAISATIMIGAESLDPVEQPGGGLEYVRRRVLEIQTAQVSNYGRGGKAVIDGETWTVHEVLSVEAGLARVLTVCPQKTDRAGRRLPQR